MIFGGFIFVILLGLANAYAPTLYANHRALPLSWHQANIHSNAAGEEEAICGINASTHVSLESFLVNVQRKLFEDNPAEDWDSLAIDKIYFDMPLVNLTVQPCTAFPNRSAIPIEIYLAHNVGGSDPADDANVKATWARLSPCGNISCTSNENVVYNPVMGHDDATWSYVWFQENRLYLPDHSYHTDAQRSFIISHEFGHVLGLGDGGWQGDTLCNSSIMHDGKGVCAPDGVSVVWPLRIDRVSVMNNVGATYLPDLRNVNGWVSRITIRNHGTVTRYVNTYYFNVVLGR
jgi:hypothetical protein